MSTIMPDIKGYVVFCEDIRLEYGNQVSFIGVYPKSIHSFDVDDEGDIVLSKIAAACYIALPTSEAGSIPRIEISLEKTGGDHIKLSVDELAAIPERSKAAYVNGVKFVQFEGIVASPGDILNVNIFLNEHSLCLGRFRILGKDKDTDAPQDDENSDAIR